MKVTLFPWEGFFAGGIKDPEMRSSSRQKRRKDRDTPEETPTRRRPGRDGGGEWIARKGEETAGALSIFCPG